MVAVFLVGNWKETYELEISCKVMLRELLNEYDCDISKGLEETFIHNVYIFAINQGEPAFQNNPAVIVFNLSHASLEISLSLLMGCGLLRAFNCFQGKTGFLPTFSLMNLSTLSSLVASNKATPSRKTSCAIVGRRNEWDKGALDVFKTGTSL